MNRCCSCYISLSLYIYIYICMLCLMIMHHVRGANEFVIARLLFPLGPCFGTSLFNSINSNNNSINAAPIAQLSWCQHRCCDHSLWRWGVTFHSVDVSYETPDVTPCRTSPPKGVLVFFSVLVSVLVFGLVLVFQDHCQDHCRHHYL